MATFFSQAPIMLDRLLRVLVMRPCLGAHVCWLCNRDTCRSSRLFALCDALFLMVNVHMNMRIMGGMVGLLSFLTATILDRWFGGRKWDTPFDEAMIATAEAHFLDEPNLASDAVITAVPLCQSRREKSRRKLAYVKTSSIR